jgi:hypothetical protein
MSYTQGNDLVLLLTDLFKELSENHGDLVWTIVEYNWFPEFINEANLKLVGNFTVLSTFDEFVEKYYKKINLLIGKDWVHYGSKNYADLEILIQYARELQPKVLKILSEFEQ